MGSRDVPCSVPCSRGWRETAWSGGRGCRDAIGEWSWNRVSAHPVLQMSLAQRRQRVNIGVHVTARIFMGAGESRRLGGNGDGVARLRVIQRDCRGHNLLRWEVGDGESAGG